MTRMAFRRWLATLPRWLLALLGLTPLYVPHGKPVIVQLD